MKNISNLSSECFNCPEEILFKNLYIASRFETLDEIIKYNKSISRYGDGEYNLISGISHYFQTKSEELINRLSEILNSNEEKCLIGIYYPYKKEELDLYTDKEANYWKKYSNENKFKLYKIIKQNKKFYSSAITKFYNEFKDKSIVPQYIEKHRKIWEGRDIIIVEGNTTRLGIGNDLFNNTKSIKRIICPSSHAFNFYNKILEAVLQFDKNNLILISLGPTATILSFDLCKLGYQAIDIGHTDYAYESFLEKRETQKYKSGAKNISESQKVIYNQQIVNRIGTEYFK
jgi:glycosyltransferase family protein